MADIAITQGVVQQVQPTPQAAAPTIDAGNAAELSRADQVVNVPPQVNADGNGQAQQGERREDIVASPQADAEQESANIVLNRESDEQSVVVRLRYSVSEEQVYLEIVDLDTNATVGRIPRESVLPPVDDGVPLTTEPRSATETAPLVAQSTPVQAPVADVNPTLAQFFEQQ